MQISDIGQRRESDVARVEACVTWEDADVPPFTLFVDTDLKFQNYMWADPNAFLLSCYLPAWRAGERRVKVDGSLCPVLRFNMRTAVATLKAWFGSELGPEPIIEASLGFTARSPCLREAASLLLLSCGIDSLSTLRWNKLHLPSNHPASIKGVILVAHDDHLEPSAEELVTQTQGRLSAASEVAADAEAEPIPVRTNMYWLVNNGYFYDEKWHGAVLSSIAHFFSKRFHRSYISSGRILDHGGSHPLLDSYYTSSHFQIEHYGYRISRFEKTAVVAEWPAGLQNIRVCQNDDSGTANCGTCGKCIETMTALVALDKLKHCKSFPVDDVSPELLQSVQEYDMIRADYQARYYEDLIPRLEECGRADLVEVIRQFPLTIR